MLIAINYFAPFGAADYFLGRIALFFCAFLLKSFNDGLFLSKSGPWIEQQKSTSHLEGRGVKPLGGKLVAPDQAKISGFVGS